ncbi:multicopper oxidase family protein [Ramlibacter sp. WS9]|uniref:multicopper oxidase family protein n=1 Tax=Ramlibacter sp. WS9 TaxID=1882741 RepID=UPI0011414D4B|nr:multicopper oxidase domain-containing protein [Ramlibacter sp. WS9]ROZ76650.1 copper oxidase [Ramlibacter sp. WS9]
MPLSRIPGLTGRRSARTMAALAVALGCTSAWSQATNPCAYTNIDVARYGRQELRNPPNISAQGGALTTTLDVQYTDPKTTSIAGCPVMLRTYNGQLVGPTLRVRPGETMNVMLNNRLPKETPDQIQQQFEQENKSAHLSTRPASFNTTNLHTHGLHVSPVGNSDNVLLAIAPGSRFGYEVKVPRSHPPGSFWYHAHTHGSTSIQVGSGMGGALIIDDDEAKIPAALREANRNEKVMVFQTILYDTQGRLDDITALFPSPSNPADCSQPGNQKTWTCSKRRTTINGQIVPRIRMRPGEVQRWRMIDTGFRETINVVLEGHQLHEIALDGLYLGRVDTWQPGQPVELQPGYRSDVLVKASLKPGVYRLLDAASAAATSVRGAAEPENVLAEVVVDGPMLDMKLPTSQEMAALAPFPGVDLTKTAHGVQQVDFKLGQDMQGKKNYFQVNAQAFNPQHVRQVKLNATDMWAVSTVGDPPGVPNGIPPLPHVFHIHVNPFQTSRAGPDGKAQMVWKDTLLIPSGQTRNLYTQYLDYIGSFVLHCHILDHEDLGMMEVVEVVDESSGVAHGSPAGHRH